MDTAVYHKVLEYPKNLKTLSLNIAKSRV